AEMTSPRCSTLEHSIVISRSVRSPFASTVSTATMAPPARVIAAVTLPSTPPCLWGSATRSVSENCAEGVAMPSQADDTDRPSVDTVEAVADGDARELWLIDGNSLVYRAFFALPE